jgi:hypothetical protein
MQLHVDTECQPLCGLAEAIFLFANQPRNAPPDPCGALVELPSHQPSRWLLSFLPALRAMSHWGSEVDPSVSDEWRQREQRLGLRPAHSLWPFDLDEIWSARVEAMRENCVSSSLSPAAWVARWSPYEPAALAYLGACEQRSAALLNAAATLHRRVAASGGTPIVGRDARTGRLDRVALALLFDPEAHWTRDRRAEAELYSGAVVFAGGLRTSSAEFTELMLAAADVYALRIHEHTLPASAQRSLTAAVRQTALLVFPSGPPAGMRALARDTLIAEAVVRMSGHRPSARTIRAGISDLWNLGARRRRT